jgi:hypothetical protein
MRARHCIVVTSTAGAALDFNAVLLALMDRVGRRVRISICAAHRPRPASHVVDVEGTLAAGWDPSVLQENGVEDGAVLGIEESDAFSLYLLRQDFKTAEGHGDQLVIFTGGVTVVVQPPYEGVGTD